MATTGASTGAAAIARGCSPGEHALTMVGQPAWPACGFDTIWCAVERRVRLRFWPAAAAGLVGRAAGLGCDLLAPALSCPSVQLLVLRARHTGVAPPSSIGRLSLLGLEPRLAGCTSAVPSSVWLDSAAECTEWCAGDVDCTSVGGVCTESGSLLTS